MNNKNTEALISKYPKIFKLITDPYQGPQLPISLFTFEHDNGWFNIIELLCGQIQGHINWKRKQRAIALKFNRALKRALAGNKDSLIKHFTSKSEPSDYTLRLIEETIEKGEYRNVPEKIRQVVAVQVKEKFGTLRFYYDGGDEYIHGLAAMAEAMSARTCESCGVPATQSKGGWIKTMCQLCIDTREQRRQQELAEYNAKHEDVYQKIKENTNVGANGN